MLINWFRLPGQPRLPLRVALIFVLFLTACGGGGDAPQVPVPVPVNVVGQGEFKTATLLKSLSIPELTASFAAAGDSGFVASPKYAVTAWRLNYQTVDGLGQPILASALVVLPQKPDGALSPVLSYQHGTLKREIEAPSNMNKPASPEVQLASLGYLVVSADYVGYGASKGASHPYLLAAPSAAVVIDMLTATSYWRQTQKIPDNGQLFMTGYSEGGYVTMAAHRALQASTLALREQIVSVATGAGPYDVVLTFDETLKLVQDAYPLLGALLQPGFLKYLSGADRNNVRDALLKQLLGSDADVTFLPTTFDYYFADNKAAMKAYNDVYDWQPQRPVALFHGQSDKIVPYNNSSHTLQVMQAKGAGSQVTLTHCQAQPSDHSECVRPFWFFVQETFGKVAKNL